MLSSSLFYVFGRASFRWLTSFWHGQLFLPVLLDLLKVVSGPSDILFGVLDPLGSGIITVVPLLVVPLKEVSGPFDIF